MAMPTADIPSALSAYDSLVGGLSLGDKQNLNDMINSAGYFLGQTGFMPKLGTIPGPGMPSTDEQKISGWYIDPVTGQRSPILASQALYGGTADNPTLEAMNDQGTVFGKPTVAQQHETDTTGLGALGLMGSLSGPRNAFAQQAVEHGLNSLGLSKSVDAIAGRLNLPTVEAPQAAPQAQTLSTMVQDMRNAANGGSASGFSANDTGNLTQRYSASLPDPNKIVSSEWMKLSPDDQAFLQSAYGAKGYSANDLNQAIQGNLPGFKAPTGASSAFGAGFVGA